MLLERLGVELGQLLPVPGTQYDDVQAAEFVDHPPGGPAYRGLVGDVDRYDGHPLSGERTQSTLPARGHRHPSASSVEGGGEGRADPRRGTDDPDSASGQLHELISS